MNKKILGMTLFFLTATAAQASLVTVQFAINPTSIYDYPSGSYVPLGLTTSGVLSLTFDIDERAIRDYGNTTITWFGGDYGTTWSSPVTSLLPLDPYTGAYGNIYHSSTFPNVNDYSSSFHELAISQADSYQVVDGEFSVYHISVIAMRQSAARSGDGTSDYAFTRDALLDFYRSFQESNAPVRFAESYEVYRFQNGLPVYSDGKLWTDYHARVINVIDHAEIFTVGEPTIFMLLAAGAIPLLMVRRRKADNWSKHEF